MYLILSYRDTTNISDLKNGKLRIELDQNLQFIPSFGNTYPQVYPNGEKLLSTSGQIIEWSYDWLDYNEVRSILVPVYVLPNASGAVNINASFESFGVEGDSTISSIEESNQLGVVVELSHDPNMMSEFSDEQRLCSVKEDTIAYTVKFQNTGKAPTQYVKVTCYLDDKVDLNSIANIEFPEFYDLGNTSNSTSNGYDVTDRTTWACWSVDHNNRSITFEMNMLILRSLSDSTCLDLNATRSEVSFTVNVKSDYVFGPDVVAEADIFFDANAPIRTNKTYSGCKNALPVGQGGGFQTANTSPCPKCAPICYYIIIGLSLLVIILLLILILRRKKGRQKG
jgi:hypothetical protein